MNIIHTEAMKTELLYLEDTYMFEGTAIFLEVREHEKGTALILDRTIFYPQGGGQPSDVGHICAGDVAFKVTFVGLDPEGVVYHIGAFETGDTFTSGSPVTLEIDSEKRIQHARIHSAGHLLDVAVYALNLPIKATKGFHFPEGPYVEYDGVVENPEQLLAALEVKVNELVDQNIPVRRTLLTEDEAYVKGFHAPLGKSVRVVHFEGDAGCGCGGTHVRNSGEIGKVTIRKISSKQGKTRIAYSI